MTPTETQPTTTTATTSPTTITIADKCVVLSINRGTLKQSEKLGIGQYQTAEGIDQDLTTASVKLLQCEEAKAINSHYNFIRSRIIALKALPSPFKSGMYLVPLNSVAELDREMAAAEAAHYELVDKLMTVYDERIAQDQSKLGPAFDQANYTPASVLKQRLYLTHQWFSIDTPGSGKLPPEVMAAERKKMADAWTEAREGIQELLRANMRDLVGHLQDALTGQRDGGKPKIFRDSAVTNITTFLKTFDARNITNDAELGLLVGTVKQMLDVVTPDMLRTNTEVRELIRDEFGVIRSQLDTMLVNAPSRLVNLRDDEDAV